MFSEDLDLFFDDNDFGIEVTLDGRIVVGILSNPYEEAGFVESTNPTFTFKSADAPDVSHASVLIAPTQKYNIVNVAPDGTGVTRLELRETT